MRIANLRSWRTNSGGSHVEADIDGEPLWFASDDAELAPSPEAFASALLMAAATRGEPLEVEGPVDRLWLERVPAIVRQAQEWWQLPGTRVIAADVIDTRRLKPGTTAQCFTGGVDLFYALITAKALPGILVYAHRYDLDLTKFDVDAFLPGLREVAASFGARAVLIATNLQEHSASQCVDIRRSHGGALAALGHVLAEEVERLVIPSSYPTTTPSRGARTGMSIPYGRRNGWRSSTPTQPSAEMARSAPSRTTRWSAVTSVSALVPRPKRGSAQDARSAFAR